MKIKLINVSVYKAIRDDGFTGEMPKNSFPSLGLVLIAALTPGEYDVDIIQDQSEEIDYNKDIDIVGLSFFTPAALRAYKIGDKFREIGVKVIMGGVHASALPQEAAEHCDAVVVGEAEHTWPELLRDVKNGTLKKIYRQDSYIEMDKIPLPRRDLLKKEHYITTNVIQASRGCPLDCEFCSINSMFGKKIRHQPVEQVIHDIKTMDNNLVLFTDDNIALDVNYAKELFTKMIPLKRSWVGETSWTVGNNPELLQLMKKSGCRALLIGFESIRNQYNVKKISKHEDMRTAYMEIIKNVHKAGIAILGAFIFGFDNDDDVVFKETLDFMIKARLELIQVSSLIPFPDTPLYHRLIKENRLVEKNWAKFTYDPPGACFEPKQLSSRQVKTNIKYVYDEFYRRRRIFKRSISVIKNIKSFKILLYFIVASFTARKNTKYGFSS